MKLWNDSLGYWMGWIVAALVGVGCCFFLAIRMFAYDTFCRPEELCLREWVSALSGVLGVLAAFASLAYVARQFEQASKHHRDAMKVQLQRTRTVARRARRAAQQLRSMASHYEAVWGGTNANHRLVGRGDWDLSQQIEGLLQAVSNPVFSAFEEEIDFVAPQPAAQIKEAFEAQLKSLGDHSNRFSLGVPRTRYFAEDAFGVVVVSARYADELVRLAEQFLSDTEDLVRH
ncbi:hypothetical protein J2T08_003624 [Neorhizobium galegae]|uniref:hypothetical protein n=1 Tax=Neorhizobium galegae TaxID=399 RepID=UPI002785B9CC|nr:hypothetical protein [Neorhizobium galegae]MDQ0135703.1 hypothetical protein [Neorhizobium galegae]